jgi:hypothetical protein
MSQKKQTTDVTEETNYKTGHGRKAFLESEEDFGDYNTKIKYN